MLSISGRCRKLKLYGDDSSQSQSSTGDLGDITGKVVRICIYMCTCQGGKPDTGKLHSSGIAMNVCGSTCEMGAWSMVCVLWQQIEY